MKALVWQYGKELMRNPWEVLMMLGLTVLFAFVISGGSDSAQSQNDVRVYSTSLSDEALHGIVDRLNSEKPTVQFSIVTEEEAMELMNREVVEGVVNLGESLTRLSYSGRGRCSSPLCSHCWINFIRRSG